MANSKGKGGSGSNQRTNPGNKSQTVSSRGHRGGASIGKSRSDGLTMRRFDKPGKSPREDMIPPGSRKPKPPLHKDPPLFERGKGLPGTGKNAPPGKSAQSGTGRQRDRREAARKGWLKRHRGG